jgi:hypothetical protein
MKNRNKILFFVLLISNSYLFAQQSRLDMLGKLSYSIIDIDSQIDPFILGGNPAWLVNSHVNPRLEINPFYTNSKGDYQRFFESGDVSNINMNFIGIKPLGSSGTFRGSASYNYQLQKNRNRALTLEPYSGDAFFFTDTTSGDYKYSGPTFEFMHSLELFDDFYFGATVSYQILDGLKKVYTFAETLYRNVSGNFGVAYKYSDKITFGFNYKLIDSQERITSNDINNTDVQTFLYRGETYKIELRGSSQDYKIKKNGNEFSFQTQYKPFENLTMGLDAKYSNYNSFSLFPVSSLDDVEDGYSSFEKINIILQTRWIKSESIVLAFTAGLNNTESWTKNSKLALTLWDLTVENKFVGLGSSFYIEDDILIAAEYEMHSSSADSLKYIDNKFTKKNALNHVARLGFESGLAKYISFRFGYNFILKQHDFVLGGDNVSTHLFKMGFKINISETVELEPRLEYLTTNLKDSKLNRNEYGIYTTLRFFEF